MPNKISTDGVLFKRLDEYTRHDPTKAVATAFGFGFLLNILPLGTMAAMATSLLFALSRPVLLFLGFLKLVDLARSNSVSTAQSHE